MKSTVSISEGQNHFPALVKAVAKGRVITITRHNEPVACVMSFERLSAMAETVEIMADPAAMKAIRDHQAGKTKCARIEDIPE